MGAVKIIGVILIILGIIGLIWGGITYTKERNVADLGPLEIETEEKESIPLPPIVSGVALAVGIILILAGGRGSRRGPSI